MMGLAHGKVSECTARLALAQGMIKVDLVYDHTQPYISKISVCMYTIFSPWKSIQRLTGCQIVM